MNKQQQITNKAYQSKSKPTFASLVSDLAKSDESKTWADRIKADNSDSNTRLLGDEGLSAQEMLNMWQPAHIESRPLYVGHEMVVEKGVKSKLPYINVSPGYDSIHLANLKYYKSLMSRSESAGQLCAHLRLDRQVVNGLLEDLTRLGLGIRTRMRCDAIVSLANKGTGGDWKNYVAYKDFNGAQLVNITNRRINNEVIYEPNSAVGRKKTCVMIVTKGTEVLVCHGLYVVGGQSEIFRDEDMQIRGTFIGHVMDMSFDQKHWNGKTDRVKVGVPDFQRTNALVNVGGVVPFKLELFIDGEGTPMVIYQENYLFIKPDGHYLHVIMRDWIERDGFQMTDQLPEVRLMLRTLNYIFVKQFTQDEVNMDLIDGYRMVPMLSAANISYIRSKAIEQLNIVFIDGDGFDTIISDPASSIRYQYWMTAYLIIVTFYHVIIYNYVPKYDLLLDVSPFSLNNPVIDGYALDDPRCSDIYDDLRKCTMDVNFSKTHGKQDLLQTFSNIALLLGGTARGNGNRAGLSFQCYLTE